MVVTLNPPIRPNRVRVVALMVMTPGEITTDPNAVMLVVSPFRGLPRRTTWQVLMTPRIGPPP